MLTLFKKQCCRSNCAQVYYYFIYYCRQAESSIWLWFLLWDFFWKNIFYSSSRSKSFSGYFGYVFFELLILSTARKFIFSYWWSRNGQQYWFLNLLLSPIPINIVYTSVSTLAVIRGVDFIKIIILKNDMRLNNITRFLLMNAIFNYENFQRMRIQTLSMSWYTMRVDGDALASISLTELNEWYSVSIM